MRFISFFLLFICTSVAAQEPVEAELLSGKLQESYQPDVSISGSVIVGVMSAGVAAAVASDGITIQPQLNPGAGDICLRVASRDGIYMSRNAYGIPDGGERSVRLPYDTDHDDELDSYVGDENGKPTNKLAVSATTGNCESEPDQYKYLLLSAQGSAPAEDVVILVNSFGATDVFYKLGPEDADTDPVDCTYISEGKRTAYDYVCSLGDIRQQGDVQVSIIRERFGRAQPDVELTILSNSE